jgi:hypothetical protein
LTQKWLMVKSKFCLERCSDSSRFDVSSTKRPQIHSSSMVNCLLGLNEILIFYQHFSQLKASNNNLKNRLANFQPIFNHNHFKLPENFSQTTERLSNKTPKTFHTKTVNKTLTQKRIILSLNFNLFYFQSCKNNFDFYFGRDCHIRWLRQQIVKLF